MKKKFQKQTQIMDTNIKKIFKKAYQMVINISLKSHSQLSSRELFFLFLLLIVPLVGCQNNTKDKIVNGDFSKPIVNNLYQLFNLSIQGWKCTQTCEIQNCILGRQYWLNENKTGCDCIGQVIDLNSNFFHQTVSQEMDLSAGRYILHFTYYYPVAYANDKMMQVTFNEETILYVHPQVAASFNVFQFQATVQAIQGYNKLAFSNHGKNDGIGFRINNVSLYRSNDVALENFVQVISQGSVVNTLPGARVIFRSVMSFFINFDRLELYIYHNRRFSYNAQLLILASNRILNVKSDLAINTMRLVQNYVVQENEKFLRSFNFKNQYMQYPSFSAIYRNKGYLDCLNQSFIYFFPFVVLILIIMNLFFQLLFHRPISLLFRKFSLWAILLIMMFDGNIQSLTFFTFAELKLFFSKSYYHKFINIAILLIFFILIFTVFCLLQWGKYHYKKKVKFLIDEVKSDNKILWGIAIDRGIICFLFGCIHQLLINNPDLQLILLVILEVAWIIKKIIYLFKNYYDEKWLVRTSLCSSLCRIFFQVSSFGYQKYPEERIYINQTLHRYLIYAAIFCSLLQIIVAIYYCLKSSIKAFTVRNSNKIIDNFNHQEKSLNRPRYPNMQQIQQQKRNKAGFNSEIRQISCKQRDEGQKKFIRGFRNNITIPRPLHKQKIVIMDKVIMPKNSKFGNINQFH